MTLNDSLSERHQVFCLFFMPIMRHKRIVFNFSHTSDNYLSEIMFLLCKTGRGLSDNEVMAWRHLQLQLSAEQHKQLMFSTPQMTSPPPPPLPLPPSTSSSSAAAVSTSSSSSLFTLQDMMIKQEHFERRRMSESDFENEMKMPKLTPISNINTCPSTSLPLSFTSGLSLLSAPYCVDSPLSSSSEAASSSFSSMMSHREKLQNQQYLDRLRRMNERGKERQMRSRVNYEPSNIAKTVREELASRKQHTKKGKRATTFSLHTQLSQFMRVFDEFCVSLSCLISLLFRNRFSILRSYKV